MSIQPIFAIVNPQAGSGRTQKAWPRVLGLLKTKFEEIDWTWTRAPGHATDLARDALDKGYQCILSVGGDGTHNEIANAFLHSTGSAHPEAVLATLSMGTGSDLRRSLGIPKDVQSAVSVLADGRVAAVDVGWLTFIGPKGQEQQRYFLNITSLGIGGEVDLRVNLTTKALGGFFAFLWGTLSTLCTYQSKRVRFALDAGPWRKEKIILIAVANGQYFGGGMWMAPQAALDDGALDVIVVKDMNRLELIAQLGRIYIGTHLTHRKVEVYRVHGMVAESPDEVWLDVDGEPLGILPIEFRVLPRTLRVAVGPGFRSEVVKPCMR